MGPWDRKTVKIEYNHWHIEVEVDATRAAYAAILQGDAASCPCDMCRNFVAQRGAIYPAAILGFFDRLGIDPDKELTNSSFTTSPGKHVYSVSHCFVGLVQPDALRADYDARDKRISEIMSEGGRTTDPAVRERLIEEAVRLANVNTPPPGMLESPISFYPENLTSVAFPSPCGRTATSVTLPWVIDSPEPALP